MNAAQWLLWSPRRFYGVATATAALVLLVCLLSILGGVHRLTGDAPRGSSITVPAAPTSAPGRDVTPSAASIPTGRADPVAAALQLAPDRPTGKAFVESGDTSQAVVRVPVSGGALDVTVVHDDAGWTATSYATAR